MLEKNIIVNRLNIKYFESDGFNNNDPIIFLHGWKSESKHLKPIYENLKNFIAIDLPGFGKSDLPLTVWSTDEYAEFLKSFLEKLEIKNPILVGHSFGGAVIIKYLANGGSAKKIILIASAGIRKKNAKIYFYNAVAKIFKLPFYLPGLNLIEKKIRRAFYEVIDSTDYIEAGVLTESYKKIIRDDLGKEMKKINTPTTLIWGEDDKATPLANARKMNELINGSKLEVIKNAGHFVFLENKEEFDNIFINEI